MLLNIQEEAEEVVHDVFVTLWKKRATLSILNSFHTYMAAILKYKCFEVLAKRNLARRKASLDNMTVEHEDPSTQQWLDFKYLREELEQAICQLPEKCQLIFRLSREHYLTDKEIAEKLDISVNTVRTQMHRALQKLKASLNSFFCL